MEWSSNCIQYLSTYFEYQYPFSKMDFVYVPEMAYGAMEHPGCITITDNFVASDQPSIRRYHLLFGVVLHEVTHMWFGNLVTMQWWDDLWLNESFATFISNYIQNKVSNEFSADLI